MTENTKKISKVRLRHVSGLRNDGRFFLYMEIVEGKYSGDLVTMWVEQDNDLSDERVCALAKIFGVPPIRLQNAINSGDTNKFTELAGGDKVFSIIWRFGDTNSKITFVDELF